MRLEAALMGNLNEVMREELERGARAVSNGTSQTISDLQRRLRFQTISAFNSPRLANAWRATMYPRLPTASLGAAGTVHSNAPHIIEAFSNATPIRSAAGWFLAIPSPDAPKQYMGKRVSPSNWNDERYGRLRFVYRPGKSSLLVVDGVRRNKSGSVGRQLANQGIKPSGGYRAGASTVVMFFLVPQIRFKKVFDLDADYGRAQREMVSNILAAWGAK